MLDATTRRENGRRFARSTIASSSTAVPMLLTLVYCGDLVHALADAHRRGEVVDRVDPVERPVHRAAVAHVAHHQLDLGIEVLGAAPVGGRVAVHLLRERVERPHAMAVSQEQVGEVRADEARAAGDQDGLPHGAW
jgi:hypothetical protein